MGIRVAVATSDNIVVNQHFGHSQHFFIYDVNDEEDFRLIEDRRVKPPCSFGEHDQNCLEEAIQQLADCQYVLCKRIGSGALCMLLEYGIQCYEVGDYINSSLKVLWHMQHHISE
jgi:Uncharacterized conserved protein